MLGSLIACTISAYGDTGSEEHTVCPTEGLEVLAFRHSEPRILAVNLLPRPLTPTPLS